MAEGRRKERKREMGEGGRSDGGETAMGDEWEGERRSKAVRMKGQSEGKKRAQMGMRRHRRKEKAEWVGGEGRKGT